MKVKVVSRKLVKPSKATPPHLGCYKLSLLDQINPAVNHTRILYYSCDDEKSKCDWLEESMAQILSNFYPLAGRYNKEKQQVDCNDQGALFATSQVDVDLSLILRSHVDPQQLNHLLPVDLAAVDGPTDPILAVQINMFQCGGLAVAVCASHRVFDDASFASFLAAWAKAAHTTGKLLIQPYFDDHRAYFPVENLPPHNDQPHAVSTFLAQALLRADIARRGEPRASLIGQLINIRERTVPWLPKHAFGTWISGSFLELAPDETAAGAQGKNFPSMASRIRHAMVQGIHDCALVLRDKEFGRKLMVGNFLDANKKAETGDCKVIWLTDLSKTADYELDFGFGKPDWVSIATPTMVSEAKDYIIMLNNRSNDGIEAWVCLQQSDMQFFRQDKEILLLSATSLGVFSRI